MYKKHWKKDVLEKPIRTETSNEKDVRTAPAVKHSWICSDDVK